MRPYKYVTFVLYLFYIVQWHDDRLCLIFGRECELSKSASKNFDSLSHDIGLKSYLRYNPLKKKPTPLIKNNFIFFIK